jgi:hypothetical protein
MRKVNCESSTPLLEAEFPDTTLLCADEALSALVQQSIKTFDKLAPAMIISKPTYLRKTFISSTTKSLIKERDSVQREFHKRPGDPNLKIRLTKLKHSCKINIKCDSKSEMDL